MKQINYDKFQDPTKEFGDKEVRACCYTISKKLIDEAKTLASDNWYTHEKTIDGIIILLFCWNFASTITKKLTRDAIKEVLQNSKYILKQLEGKTILNFDENDRAKILKVYKNFKKVMGQTGASKALSLLNSDLFVMWDTDIRKKLNKKLVKGIDNGEEPEHYLCFLQGIKQIILTYHLLNKVSSYPSLAKKIDEYHYVCAKL